MLNEVATYIEDRNDIIQFVANGILILHESSSGNFLMLKNCIESSYKSDYPFYALKEDHPAFQGLVSIYKVQYLPAMLIVEKAKVIEIIESPISKSEITKIIEKTQLAK